MPEKNWPLITGRERGGGGALQNRRAGAKSKFTPTNRGVGGKMLSMLNDRGGGGGVRKCFRVVFRQSAKFSHTEWLKFPPFLPPKVSWSKNWDASSAFRMTQTRTVMS